jgi:hypothetical protein
MRSSLAGVTRRFNALLEIAIQTTPNLMVTFQPDRREADPGGPIETALFLGVRHEPALEST